MSGSAQQWSPVRYSQTPLGAGVTSTGVSYPGGLDLNTPSLRLQAGALNDVLNFECGQFGGYTRIKGYERFDGRFSPSSAVFVIVQLAAFVNVPAAGQNVTQAGSGATGTVVAVVTSPVPYVVLTAIAGVFDGANALTTPGPVSVGTAVPRTAGIDPKTKAIYTSQAADIYRALIGLVPGEGPVRGVVSMAFLGVDQVFAFRGNPGQSQVLLWKATAAGWIQVPFYNLVTFTAANGAVPLDGDVLHQGGVSATIMRVMSQGGETAVGWTGAGYGQFVVVNPTGGNFAAGAASSGSGATFTLAGPQAPITMASGGKFQFEKSNFAGQAITRRIYGCDGVNPAFSFDGVTLAPIKTGLNPNRPSFIKAHQNLLFLGQDASLIYPAIGDPYKWSAVDGGGEIATGDTLTGMISLPGSETTAVLAIFLRTNTAFLYGTDPATFNFVIFNQGIGAAPYSAQSLFDTFFLDDLGVVTLKTTQNYGNFTPATLTKNILPFIVRERGNLLASSISREKSQFRLFFSDGYALYATVLNQQYLGSSLMLFPNPMNCVDQTKLTTETEATFAGSTNGYVYQLDKGTSFDGAAIPAYFVQAWDPIRSPRVIKRFRAASIEVQGESYAEIQYGYQIGYNNPQLAQLPAALQVLNLGEIPHWDDFVWDAFSWDGTGLTPSDIDETGSAESIRVTITSGTNYIDSYTVNSIIHHYSMRRGLRV